ncbi:recombinase family protein [Streptomyces sp. NPDC056910]|uniref:recombinase family protein n=1 Tax=Streptomyces sp. NPDC056910 TaxID=3345964 RepID=UPI003676257E
MFPPSGGLCRDHHVSSRCRPEGVPGRFPPFAQLVERTIRRRTPTSPPLWWRARAFRWAGRLRSGDQPQDERGVEILRVGARPRRSAPGSRSAPSWRRRSLAYDIKEAAPHQEVVLTVHKLKWLARNAAELMTLSGQLQDAGVQLELLTGPLTGIYDPNGMGAMFFAVAAQLDRNYIWGKTLEGQAAAAAEGQPRRTPQGRRRRHAHLRRRSQSPGTKRSRACTTGATGCGAAFASCPTPGFRGWVWGS